MEHSEDSAAQLADYGGYGAGGEGSEDPAQTYFIGLVPGSPIVIHEQVRAKLSQAMDASSSVQSSLGRRGRMTNRAWRLGHGDFKVFARPPKTKGRLRVLVDVSGSMGYNCDCHGVRKDGASSGETYATNGWLAWQTVGALAERFPDLEVYAYTTDDNSGPEVTGRKRRARQCGVWQVPAGEKPLFCADDRTANTKLGPGSIMYQGGTPDSNALAWMNEELRQVEDVTLVHICDGQPNNQGATFKVAHAMFDRGLRYATVLVGGGGGDTFGREPIYPSSTSVCITKISQMDAVAEVIELAAARGAG